MAAFFLDTSTVLKRYVQETGTAWLQALAAPTVRHSLFVVRITLAETVAAITRRERGGSITPQDAATAVADFQLDFARQYRIVEVSAQGLRITIQRFTLELRTLLSFSLDFLASSVGLVCDPRVNRCSESGVAGKPCLLDKSKLFDHIFATFR